MGIEKWVAGVSLALFFMFFGEMITIYVFMTDVPEDFEFGLSFDADPKILQFISIGFGPASIMAGLSYLMARRYGSKPIGFLIIAGGVVMIIGMAYCYYLVDKIAEPYMSDTVTYTPIVFMILSIPVMLLGASLLKIKTKKPRKEYY